MTIVFVFIFYHMFWKKCYLNRSIIRVTYLLDKCLDIFGLFSFRQFWSVCCQLPSSWVQKHCSRRTTIVQTTFPEFCRAILLLWAREPLLGLQSSRQHSGQHNLATRQVQAWRGSDALYNGNRTTDAGFRSDYSRACAWGRMSCGTFQM